MSLHPKVLVIGAGVSGLACARELTYRSHQVLVVEARERAGGRLHSVSLGNTMVDVGGALIHGIQNNPVSSVCYQMGIPTRVVDGCLLMEGNGIPVDPKHDAQLAEQFNACLEKTFENIQNTATKESSSFGQLFDRLSPRTKDPLFMWHQANLELSCGAPLNQLGYEWNDDEPYGYDGAHVSLTSGWKSVVEGLSEGLNIMYGSPIQQIRVVNGTVSPRRSKRRNGGRNESWDSKQNGDKVYVTLASGKVLEADAVVCTLPLGILKIPPSSPGGIEFDPPLNEEKQTAIQQLGCGLLNKCAIQFPYRFWSDESDFLGVVDEKSWPHLILGGQDSTLIFMFGGEYAPQVEQLTDKKVMEMCMSVLQKITPASVPPPLDYHVTRWSQDSYARGAFVYIPPSSSMQDLEIISEPIVGSTGLPLVCFAGEHTTPYHPSTIHGAFNSGIREGYRLDLSFFPYYNRHLQFEPEQVYKKTFHLKRIFKNTEPPKRTVTVKASPEPRRCRGTMTLRKRPRMNSVTRANPKRSLTNGYALKPSRRSDRVQGIPAPAIQPTGSQEDRSLVRSYESCHNWQLIQSKVLPVYGDESGESKSEAQLRARYQELKEKKPKLDPSIIKDWLAPRFGPESERVNGRDTHRRMSRRTKKTRIMVDL